MSVLDLTSADPAENAERVRWLLANGYTIKSQESDDVLELVTDEKQDGEGEQPRHPLSGKYIAGDADTVREVNEEVSEAEKAFTKAAPIERERLGERLTLARLRQLYSGAATNTTKGNTMRATKSIEAANLPALIFKLEKSLENPDLSPATRAEALAIVNQHRMSQFFTVKQAGETEIVGRAQDERQAANDAIRSAQLSASTPARFGTGSSPETQVQAIGSGTGMPQSLGVVSTAGNRGDFLGAHIGRTEPDPVIQAAQLEDELQKATDPFRRERLGDELTQVRLKMFYTAKAAANNGGEVSTEDLKPTATVDAADVRSVGQGALPSYVNKQARKAAKKARKAEAARLCAAARKALA